MKKILVILIMIPLLVGSVSAQEIKWKKKKDDNKSEKQRSDSNDGRSDGEDLPPLYSEEDRIDHETAFHKLIGEAIKRSVFIVRQDYLVEDERGNPIGRNNQPYFSRNYGLAIAADAKLWSLSSHISPWLEDDEYDDYRGRYTPIRGKAAVRQLEEREFRELDLIANVDKVDQVGYYTSQDLKNSVVTSGNRTKTEGRLVIFFVNQGEDPEKAKIEYRIQNVDPEWQANLGQIPRIKSASAKIIGGAYFIEDVIDPAEMLEMLGRQNKTKTRCGDVLPDPDIPLGMVQYKLVGLYKEIEGKSYIVSLPENEKIEKKSQYKHPRY